MSVKPEISRDGRKNGFFSGVLLGVGFIQHQVGNSPSYARGRMLMDSLPISEKPILVIAKNGKWVPIEAKLNILAEERILEQVAKYTNVDSFQPTKGT